MSWATKFLFAIFVHNFFFKAILQNFLNIVVCKMYPTMFLQKHHFFIIFQAIFSSFASYICNPFLSTELTSSYCKTYNLTRKLGFSYVSAGDSFPLTTKKGFSLRAGFENRVAIRAVDIETEPQTRVPSMSFYPDFIQILS